MNDLLRRRPTVSTAFALVALFVALSGTAVALPGKNRVDKNDYKRGSIGTRAIANNSIRSSDIRTGNVRSSDVRDDSLTGADVNEGSLGQVPSAANANRATTASRADNADSLGGVPAASHLRDVREVSATSPSDSNSPKSVKAACAKDELAIGGSGRVAGGTNAEHIVTQSTQLSQTFRVLGTTYPGGYSATGVETAADGGNWTVTAVAICAKG